MIPTLHLFAVNRPTAVRHTHLTQMSGDAVVLPPLADWLGVSRLETDQIELFPASDLGEMSLSHYLATAFDVDQSALAKNALRVNALRDVVLVVPASALPDPGTFPQTGAELTLIARLPMLHPDHHGQPLPKAPPHHAPKPATHLMRFPKRPWQVSLALAVIGVLLLILVR
ncbi:MAG: hypothetical protein ACJAQW_002176 [Paracoccaceae bacterium]